MIFILFILFILFAAVLSVTTGVRGADSMFPVSISYIEPINMSHKVAGPFSVITGVSIHAQTQLETSQLKVFFFFFYKNLHFNVIYYLNCKTIGR